MHDKEWIEEKTYDEHDDPYCVWKKCTLGSKQDCDKCIVQRIKEERQTTYCDIYDCEDCPRMGDDCDGKEEDDEDESNDSR